MSKNRPIIVPVSWVALGRLRKARAKSLAKAMRGRIALPKRFAGNESKGSSVSRGDRRTFGVRARSGVAFGFGVLIWISLSFGASAQRNHARIFSRPIHRHAVTKRGRFLARKRMWLSLSSQRSMYQQFAVLELPGIGTYRFSARVRNTASFGNGIGVAQFGERFINRG